MPRTPVNSGFAHVALGFGAVMKMTNTVPAWRISAKSAAALTQAVRHLRWLDACRVSAARAHTHD
jgi:hypothetical protein